jgi:hypothetical protein
MKRSNQCKKKTILVGCQKADEVKKRRINSRRKKNIFGGSIEPLLMSPLIPVEACLPRYLAERIAALRHRVTSKSLLPLRDVVTTNNSHPLTHPLYSVDLVKGVYTQMSHSLRSASLRLGERSHIPHYDGLKRHGIGIDMEMTNEYGF